MRARNRRLTSAAVKRARDQSGRNGSNNVNPKWFTRVATAATNKTRAGRGIMEATRTRIAILESGFRESLKDCRDAVRGAVGDNLKSLTPCRGFRERIHDFVEPIAFRFGRHMDQRLAGIAAVGTETSWQSAGDP